jgi:hypothetical protein
MMSSTRTVSLIRLLIIQAFNDYTVTASEFSNESAISFPSRDRGEDMRKFVETSMLKSHLLTRYHAFRQIN